MKAKVGRMKEKQKAKCIKHYKQKEVSFYKPVLRCNTQLVTQGPFHWYDVVHLLGLAVLIDLGGKVTLGVESPPSSKLWCITIA